DRQLSRPWFEKADSQVRGDQNRRMNTTKIEDREERKKLKRAARKKAAPKQPRPAGTARGANKKKVKKLVKGQRKR
ncbi:MAG TPA: hypothetical protein VFB75_21060, partial [Burkholderiales bacterium]|nr:hypothetical protein [Burkholderiales bacterium]